MDPNGREFWDRLDRIDEAIARERRHARDYLRHLIFFTAPAAVLWLGQGVPGHRTLVAILATGALAQAGLPYLWIRRLEGKRSALLERGDGAPPRALDAPTEPDG
jgi:hypothetical protein